MVAIVAAAPVVAEPDGKTAPIKPQAKDHPLTELWSGYYFAKKDTQGMQNDDFENPAMTWHDTGEALWTKVDGKEGKSCKSCHESYRAEEE